MYILLGYANYNFQVNTTMPIANQVSFRLNKISFEIDDVLSLCKY